MKITIYGELCDLNRFISANRANKFMGAKIKEEETMRVAQECMVQRIPAVEKYPVQIAFAWYTRTNKKDIDNVGFAKKFVLDGLVHGGVLENDDRKHVARFVEEFHVDMHSPRVDVTITPL